MSCNQSVQRGRATTHRAEPISSGAPPPAIDKDGREIHGYIDLTKPEPSEEEVAARTPAKTVLEEVRNDLTLGQVLFCTLRWHFYDISEQEACDQVFVSDYLKQGNFLPMGGPFVTPGDFRPEGKGREIDLEST